MWNDRDAEFWCVLKFFPPAAKMVGAGSLSALSTKHPVKTKQCSIHCFKPDTKTKLSKYEVMRCKILR